ncbi:MAG: DUF4012 domain-containing protein [Candidatus Magasanikbacteria bacterium]|nr:DUF4012 domain-containing protein [Candidatus Magasanikbacteria bacterium]
MSKGKIILFTVLLILVIGIGGVYRAWHNGALQKAIVQEVAQKVAPGDSGSSLLTDAMGFNGTRTYLLLFLNNTEMRPGGGFIGVYALLQMDKGTPHLIKVEGTEGFDNNGKTDFESTPSAPLAKYLQVKRWYFRDSNWSPDFASSSEKSIELFLKQANSLSLDKIDGVIGFTPSVMEELLKISGPIKIDNQEFNAANFTEKLEYEVEYGYAQKGLEFKDRKAIISTMATSILSQLKFEIVKDWPKYYAVAQKMLAQKQIVIYSTNETEENFLSARGFGGTMKKTDTDYLLWADANLGALKTDASINRELSYEIVPSSTGKYLATAKMKFTHTGHFDWRTSRYRDYVRIFVPMGSQLVGGTGQMDIEKSKEKGKIDSGDNVANSIKNGEYNLSIQKQIGTSANKLTFGLNFGKNLVAAWPGEGVAKHGDTRYDLVTDLQEDRDFKVQLAN